MYDGIIHTYQAIRDMNMSRFNGSVDLMEALTKKGDLTRITQREGVSSKTEYQFKKNLPKEVVDFYRENPHLTYGNLEKLEQEGILRVFAKDSCGQDVQYVYFVQI